MFVTKDRAPTFWRGQRLEWTIVGIAIILTTTLIGDLILRSLVNELVILVFSILGGLMASRFFVAAISLPPLGRLPFFARKYEEYKWELQRKSLPARPCVYKSASAYDRWIGGSFRQIYSTELVLIATMTTHSWEQGQQIIEFRDIQNGPKLSILARAITSVRYP